VKETAMKLTRRLPYPEEFWYVTGPTGERWNEDGLLDRTVVPHVMDTALSRFVLRGNAGENETPPADMTMTGFYKHVKRRQRDALWTKMSTIDISTRDVGPVVVPTP
jgi:hypothetical protein